MFLGAPRLKTVFANRWRAVWFGAAVLATAYCSVPDPEPEGSAEAATKAAPTAKGKPAKWWAPDKPAAPAQ